MEWFPIRHEVTGSNSAVIGGNLVLLDGVDPNWRALYNISSAPGTFPPLYHWDQYGINKEIGRRGGEWKETNLMVPAKTGFCTIQMGQNAIVISGGRVHPCVDYQCNDSSLLTGSDDWGKLSTLATKYTTLPGASGLSATEHLPDLYDGRMFHACGTYSYEGKTKLIVAGGLDEMGEKMGTTETFSEGDANWVESGNLLAPAAFLKGGTIGNTFYVVGGLVGRGAEEHADAWIYEFNGQLWEPKARMPDGRCGHGVVAVPLKYFDAFCKL